MKQKVIVPELILIRALSCLAVVMMHSITMLIGDPDVNRGLNVARLLLLFATPTFAYMSAFLIGYSKSGRSYAQTILLRVKYLLLPYLFFAAGYAAWQHYQWGVPLVDRIWYNVAGGYHGYFVLVVFQFYLFHPLFRPILERVPAWVGVPAAGLVNIAYLAALNLGLVSIPHLGFHAYRLLPAWFFYYVLGYYSGRDRDQFQLGLRRLWPLSAAMLAGGAGLLLRNALTGFLPDATSQRFEVVLYAAGVILIAFPLAGRVRRIPALLNQVNRASFGIYLLHWFFLELFRRYVVRIPGLPRVAGILLLFLMAATASALVTFALNRWKWGAYVVGRLGVDGRQGQLAPPPGAAAAAAVGSR
ncbi:MAG: acyltransferase family protein [Bacillota bacterium]|nr:MAG: hypothetical protein DIU55_05090 [Bacillota bacterium]